MMAGYIEVSELPNFEIKCSDGKEYVLLPFKHLSDIPTADVVEVVRCKDCKYGEIDDDDFPHQRFCRYSGCDWNHEYHYCGYGERGDE